jgi:hypothetical protein
MSPDGLIAPGAERPYFHAVKLVQELEVEADYGQIYIYDPGTQLPDGGMAEDADPLQWALDDAYESRRFVGCANGLIDVITPSQFNWKAPMRVEVSDVAPAPDTESWDHVVELPLPIPSGTLVFQASGGGRLIETQIPPGMYCARFAGRGYVAEAAEIEGHESYRLQLWPDAKAKPRLLKYWDGYDLKQAAE